MKLKSIPFQQHLYHEIEDWDKAAEYTEKLLPSIGAVVMYFSGMESSLNPALCEMFTDRTDSTGLMVLHKMNFAAKIDLFKRFCNDFHLAVHKEPKEYEKLVHSLKEAGRLRNLVVHADWDSTDEEGYTFVALKINQKGMEQEYLQFSEGSLSKIVDLINNTNSKLERYWEVRGELIASYPNIV